MKKIFFISLLFLSYHCLGQTINPSSIIGTPYRIGNLLVAQNDFPGEYGSNELHKLCKRLGPEWRVPTIVELKIIYKSKNIISGLNTKRFYWSSDIAATIPPRNISLDFTDGEEYPGEMYDYLPKFRAVKTIRK